MPESSGKDLRVDINLLPTLNDAAFWIIVLVILGTIISGAIGSTPIHMWPIALSLLILPVRSFLTQPGKEFSLVDGTAAESLTEQGILPYLQNVVDKLSKDIGYRHNVQLLISCRPDEARAFGTWRQHYILIGGAMAEKLFADLQDSEQRPKALALLTHELSHHLHKDVQRIGYTRFLLRDSFIILGWWALFLMGLLTLSYLALPSVLALDFSSIPGVDPAVTAVLADFITLSPSERAEITQKLQDFNIRLILNFLIYTFLPIIVIGAVLWLFYWRRMVRLQEYYADWRSAQTVGSPTFLLRAFGRYPTWFKSVNSSETSSGGSSQPGLPWRQKPGSASGSATSWSSRTNKSWKRWLALHPTYRERFAYLVNPLRLHQSWGWEALAITVLVVALEILLVSPAAGYYLSNFPIHFVTITVLILVSTWLLPLMINEQPYRSSLVKMLLLIFTIRGIWLLINMLFLITVVIAFPEWASSELNNLVIAMSRVAQQPQALPIGNIGDLLKWLPEFLILQLVPVLAVCLGLVLYYLVNRQGFKPEEVQDINWKKQHWLSVVLISAFLILVLLMPVTAIYFNNLPGISYPRILLSFGIGLLLLIPLWRSVRWSKK